MAIVYRHIRLDKNEPFYIGIGAETSRAFEVTKGRNTYWKNVISKTDYEVQILFDDLTWDEACEKEKEFITLYGRKDLGTGTLVNMTDGGEGTFGAIPWNKGLVGFGDFNKGRNHNDDTKEKISQKNKGRKLSEEHKKLINPLGRKLSDETKNKISTSNKGRIVSEETREKISKTSTGRKLPRSTKDNISNKLIGNNYGGKLILDLYTGIYYDSIIDLSKCYSTSYKKIYNQINKDKNRYLFV